MTTLLSVVIPSRNEKYLKPTILDLLKKAKGQIEIYAVLDGYWPSVSEIVSERNVNYIHLTDPRGMRNAINMAVAASRGGFIMKTDAHCLFDEGFDEKLKKECQDNWVVVPRRYSLDVDKWKRKDKPPVDYMYLSHPDDPSVWGGASLQGKEWRERNSDPSLRSVEIDDLMTSQGSLWFMKRDYFNFLELMDEDNYGSFGKEMQEIGLKCWLSGGRMVVNKKTWYAHWHKPKDQGRGYPLSSKEFLKASDYTKRWVREKVWHRQTLPFEFLINKFKPIPTWPENTNL